MPDDAEEDGCGRGEERDEQRCPPSIDHTNEEVAPNVVGSEPEAGFGALGESKAVGHLALEELVGAVITIWLATNDALAATSTSRRSSLPRGRACPA
jgi:hypothetical protein